MNSHEADALDLHDAISAKAEQLENLCVVLSGAAVATETGQVPRPALESVAMLASQLASDIRRLQGQLRSLRRKDRQ